MNTDNMSVACETIDYGPCAFMDAYDPAKVFSSIDQMGRYAYGNQPRIAQWNLARLAETLLPLLAEDDDAAVAEAERVLNLFAPRFSSELHAGFARKIGLLDSREGDQALIQGLLDAMSEGQADFTLTFRSLANATVEGSPGFEAARTLFSDPTLFDTGREAGMRGSPRRAAATPSAAP